MTDKVELIKAKVEEKINLYERLLNAGKGGGAGLMSKIVALQGVLIDINFIQIDSLPEEPVSRCLEEAAEEYTSTGYEFFDSMGHPHVAPAFKAGAQWQKEQMIKDAVDACVTDIRTYKEENEVDFTVMYEKGIIPYEIEQEVKVIVIKEG